jgi:hypothetical protein
MFPQSLLVSRKAGRFDLCLGLKKERREHPLLLSGSFQHMQIEVPLKELITKFSKRDRVEQEEETYIPLSSFQNQFRITETAFSLIACPNVRRLKKQLRFLDLTSV